MRVAPTVKLYSVSGGGFYPTNYGCIPKPVSQTGTITIDGSTLIRGTNTSFTQFAVGDYLFVAATPGTLLKKIIAIYNDTQLLVESPFNRVGTAAFSLTRPQFRMVYIKNVGLATGQINGELIYPGQEIEIPGEMANGIRSKVDPIAYRVTATTLEIITI